MGDEMMSRLHRAEEQRRSVCVFVSSASTCKLCRRATSSRPPSDSWQRKSTELTGSLRWVDMREESSARADGLAKENNDSLECHGMELVCSRPEQLAFSTSMCLTQLGSGDSFDFLMISLMS